MTPTRICLSALALASALTLAACGSGGSDSSAASTSTPTSTPTSAAPSSSAPSSSAAGAGLATASTTLGTIVTDGSGQAVYLYDKDTKGGSSSTCTGGCAALWPPVPAGGSTAGVTGTVGSITGVDGKPQATLDGWPLYYYADDSAKGDVTGQGVGGVWWVLTPAGDKVTSAAPSSAKGGY